LTQDPDVPREFFEDRAGTLAAPSEPREIQPVPWIECGGRSDSYPWVAVVSAAWILEHIELTEGRAPNDIDVVTFYRLPSVSHSGDWQRHSTRCSILAS